MSQNQSTARAQRTGKARLRSLTARPALITLVAGRIERMGGIDEIRVLSLFDGLSDAQLAELVEDGTDVSIEPGTELFHEGGHADYWWVLLDGALDLLRHVGREDTVVGQMDVPGRWPADSGPGTSTASTWRPVGTSPAACCGCPPTDWASAPTPGSRSAAPASRA